MKSTSEVEVFNLLFAVCFFVCLYCVQNTVHQAESRAFLEGPVADALLGIRLPPRRWKYYSRQRTSGAGLRKRHDRDRRVSHCLLLLERQRGEHNARRC